jgi:hypothetical protein
MAAVRPEFAKSLGPLQADGSLFREGMCRSAALDGIAPYQIDCAVIVTGIDRIEVGKHCK